MRHTQLQQPCHYRFYPKFYLFISYSSPHKVVYLPHRHKYPPNQHRKQAPKKGASELESQSLARSCQRGHIACQPSRSFAIPATNFLSPPPKKKPPTLLYNLRPVPLYTETPNHTTTF
ncbi:hypothetical protein HDV62DRAFT_10552 [Trichoderma sp. SZMC 28011]